MNKLVYFVDDDPLANQLFERACGKMSYDCMVFESANECLEQLRTQTPSIILTDLNMPGIDGFELIAEVHRSWPAVPVIAITGQSSIDRAVKAMQTGACDFIKKPFDITHLNSSITRNIQYSQLTDSPSSEIKNNYCMIGESAEIHRIYKMIDKLSRVDCPVIIAGESGTGKELAARAIHNCGNRSRSPFIAIDCGSLPDNLLESELFGHVKGAFTGATSHRTGLFESAGNGTIFLDEIGNISASMQTKLLRVCQENVVVPVGSNKNIPIRARLICASNRDLAEMVETGEFRHDLYHRINVVSLPMPSLSERRTDIPLLIDSFVSEFIKKYDQPSRQFSDEWKDRMQKINWGGNIRELRNYVERCIILAEGETLDGLPIPASDNEQPEQDTFISLKKMEQEHILRVLKSVDGNQNKAAKILEISRSTLWRKLNDNAG